MPYEVGVAYYREIARGQIRGDTTGRLKLIFHRETLAAAGRAYYRRRRSRIAAHRPGRDDLWAAHVDYFVDTVFNYPTLAECYKAAAFNGMNKLTRS